LPGVHHIPTAHLTVVAVLVIAVVVGGLVYSVRSSRRNRSNGDDES
jgi:hypothetical protein